MAIAPVAAVKAVQAEPIYQHSTWACRNRRRLLRKWIRTKMLHEHQALNPDFDYFEWAFPDNELGPGDLYLTIDDPYQ
jgi:hypothetical protein